MIQTQIQICLLFQIYKVGQIHRDEFLGKEKVTDVMRTTELVINDSVDTRFCFKTALNPLVLGFLDSGMEVSVQVGAGVGMSLISPGLSIVFSSGGGLIFFRRHTKKFGN